MQWRTPFSLLLPLLFLLAFLPKSYAAFPVYVNEPIPAVTPQTALPAHTSPKREHPVLPKIAKATTETDSNGENLGLASLILGIASVALSVVGAAGGVGGIYLLGFLMGIAALVTGAIGLKKDKTGKARGGFVLGIVVTAINILLIVIAAILLSAFFAL